MMRLLRCRVSRWWIGDRGILEGIGGTGEKTLETANTRYEVDGIRQGDDILFSLWVAAHSGMKWHRLQD